MQRVKAAALEFVVRLFGSRFLWLLSVAVWVTFFSLLTNLDPNFGVTHVGIGYCITSSDILICIQILLTEAHAGISSILVNSCVSSVMAVS
jgi:hypothetical protein